jgi:hypothetical protein
MQAYEGICFSCTSALESGVWTTYMSTGLLLGKIILAPVEQNYARCVGEEIILVHLPGIQPVYFRHPAHSLVTVVTDLPCIFSLSIYPVL